MTILIRAETAALVPPEVVGQKAKSMSIAKGQKSNTKQWPIIKDQYFGRALFALSLSLAHATAGVFKS